jgi:hypothetical protein
MEISVYLIAGDSWQSRVSGHSIPQKETELRMEQPIAR